MLKKVTIVFYGAAWCGWCKKFKPEWEAFKMTLKNMKNIVDKNGNKVIVTAKSYDDTIDKDKKIIEKENVTSFPTIRIYEDGNMKELPATPDARTVENLFAAFDVELPLKYKPVPQSYYPDSKLNYDITQKEQNGGSAGYGVYGLARPVVSYPARPTNDLPDDIFYYKYLKYKTKYCLSKNKKY